MLRVAKYLDGFAKECGKNQNREATGHRVSVFDADVHRNKCGTPENKVVEGIPN